MNTVSHDPGHGVVHGRFHYLDAMRSVLMMLGIVVHASQVFNSSQQWLFAYPDSLPVAGWLVEVLTVFRMPAFFIVSGFFSLMILEKYGAGRFLLFRAQRILIPLLITAFSVNLYQEHILAGYRGEQFSWTLFLSGGWQGHLWFLVFLLLYCLLVSAFPRHLAGPVLYLFRMRDLIPRMPVVVWLAIWSVISPLVIKLIMMVWPFDDRVGQIFYFSDILFYFQFFAAGMIFFSARVWLEKFTMENPLLIVVLLLVMMAAMSYLSEVGDSGLVRFLEKITKTYQIWLGCILCFRFFYQYCDRSSDLFRYLSNGSYTIYLFHHIFVVIFAIQMMRFDIAAYIAWPVLMLLVLAASLGVNEIVRRVVLLRWMFNGK